MWSKIILYPNDERLIMKNLSTKVIISIILIICLCSVSILEIEPNYDFYASPVKDITPPPQKSENKYSTVKSINLNSKKIRLNKGDKRYLTATVKYKNKGNKKEPVIWSSSNPDVATVTQKGVVKGKSKGVAYIKIYSKYSNKSAKCKVIVSKKIKYVAFTFDDGPGKYTDKLLNALDKYNSKATFFVLGASIKNYKDQLKHEYNSGMEIGSHTYNHKNLKTISKSEVEKEITKTNNLIQDIIGTTPTLLRPPYGNYNKTVSKLAGVPMIYWTDDTLDWKYKDKKYVAKTILKGAKDGDIILLHDIHSTSVDGFIKALPKLKKKGYELVTVSELYKIKGKKLKNGKMYFGPNND